MVLARTPEKYSSAAPLTADARQRIVSEVSRAPTSSVEISHVVEYVHVARHASGRRKGGKEGCYGSSLLVRAWYGTMG